MVAKIKASAKMENFCLEMAKGKLSASAAYRIAYDADKATPKTVNEAASRLMKNSKVAARLAELREPAVKEVGFTLKEHLDNLAELKEAAVELRQVSAAVSAEVARGKASGFYVERVKMDVKVDVKGIDEKIMALMAKLGSSGRSSRR